MLASATKPKLHVRFRLSLFLRVTRPMSVTTSLFALALCMSASSSAPAQNQCSIKNKICQYGICDGAGDPGMVSDDKALDFATQASAIDALNAALGLM